MDNPVRVKSCYGKVNISDQTISLGAFKTVHPFARTSAAQAGRLIGRENTAAGLDRSIGGFTATTAEFEEGTIILLQATRTRRGSLAAQGSIFLRLRKSAPNIMIKVALPMNHRTTLGDQTLAFLGHADIVTFDELRVLGIEVNRKYAMAYMDETEVKELFSVSEVTPGTAQRPVFVAVATSTGVEVKAAAPEPVRRIRFRG